MKRINRLPTTGRYTVEAWADFLGVSVTTIRNVGQRHGIITSRAKTVDAEKWWDLLAKAWEQPAIGKRVRLFLCGPMVTTQKSEAIGFAEFRAGVRQQPIEIRTTDVIVSGSRSIGAVKPSKRLGDGKAKVS